MKRALVVVALVVVAAQVAGANAAPQQSIPLKVGDAIDVVGTKIACFAINSSAKDGMACVLWKSSKPITGSYGVGLAVDGTVTLNRLKADGTGAPVFKRKPQARHTVYKARVGDVFGLQIDSKVSLGCRVLNVTSTLVGAAYRGVKVSCWRATATTPLPGTYGISISDKLAGVFRFDAKGRVTTWGVTRRQPTG
jgi:hypothetical protein